MGQILDLGVTHYPGLMAEGNLCRRIKICLADPALPEHLRSLENWPAPMRRQWGNDDGQAHSDAHRLEMIDGFRMARRALDEFMKGELIAPTLAMPPASRNSSPLRAG